jgi:hypothetical protein
LLQVLPDPMNRIVVVPSHRLLTLLNSAPPEAARPIPNIPVP